MRATFQLAGVAYGSGCWCMPSYVVHGDEPEGTNLRGYKCADMAITPQDSASCIGVDPHGIEQEGRYLCREWSLGPLRSDNTAAATLGPSTPRGESFAPPRSFSAVEVAHALASQPRAGAFVGQGCYCVPRDDLDALRTTRSLRCPRCAKVTVAASTGDCAGVDDSGRTRAGGYICERYVAQPRNEPDPGSRL